MRAYSQEGEGAVFGWGDDFDGEVDLSRLEVFVPAAGLSAVHAHASIAATSR